MIGLNLCPFAKAVHLKKQIRYTVSAAQTPEDLLADLHRRAAHPAGGRCERNRDRAAGASAACSAISSTTTISSNWRTLTLAGEGLEGEIQVASFHPRYQFAGTEPEDIGNYSNRSPYPMLHLLREASIARAVAAFPDAGQIFERNIETLRRLGHDGWRCLWADKP